MYDFPFLSVNLCFRFFLFEGFVIFVFLLVFVGDNYILQPREMELSCCLVLNCLCEGFHLCPVASVADADAAAAAEASVL